MDAIQEYRDRLLKVEITVLIITGVLWLLTWGAFLLGYQTASLVCALLALGFTLRGVWAIGRWLIERLLEGNHDG